MTAASSVRVQIPGNDDRRGIGCGETSAFRVWQFPRLGACTSGGKTGVFRPGVRHTARVKLVVAIIQKDDAGRVMDALLQREYRATQLNSSGGFLRKTNTTLLIGVDVSDVDDVINVIRSKTSARSEVAVKEHKAPTGSRIDLRAAIVFVVDLEGFIRL